MRTLITCTNENGAGFVPNDICWIVRFCPLLHELPLLENWIGETDYDDVPSGAAHDAVADEAPGA
jgi:hypothetical protein